MTFLGLGAAAPAGAQPAECLAGDAVDQLALSAVRAAAEAECPCDSFDGSAGRRRADYEACVAEVLGAAIGAGELRAECREAGEELLTSVTCGTSQVACGRIAPSSEAVFSCRITAESSCRGSARGTRRLASRPGGSSPSGRIRIRSSGQGAGASFGEEVCEEQTHCADVVDWTASTCFDVRLPGPHAAGARSLALTRPSSIDRAPRTIETAVWYPTTPGVGAVDSAYRAVLNAPLDLSDGP
jgi:hypothetical protein